MFKKLIIILIIAVGLIFSPYSLTIPRQKQVARMATIVDTDIATITTNTTWTLAGSPYVLSDSFYNYQSLYIAPGATLTIEPGVVVKIDGIGIEVGGKLVANGTAQAPVIFTSINDNSRGGDTNPWSDDPAQAGDWSNIHVSADYYDSQAGEIDLNYVSVNYGGFMRMPAMVYNNRLFKPNTAFAIEGANVGAISADYNSKANIANSEIFKNIIGLESYESQFTIRDSKIYDNIDYAAVNYGNTPIDAINNWWGDDSGPYHHILNSSGQGGRITDNVLFDPWIGKTVKKDPVIIVPGIMGSWNVSGQWELDPILNTYDDLWEALKLAGYKEGETLFAFPYQWRLSNVYTAGLLKDKINEVKGICDCGKVDLVAHSMGGLVARSYIEGSEYQNDIDQTIFLATPHQGATKAYLIWEGGEFGYKMKDKLQQRILTLEAEGNGYGGLFEYVRGLPMQSVQELLPIYDYLRDDETMQLRAYSDNYPVNTFLEILNIPSQLNNLNSVRIVNILADAGADSTINNLRVVEKVSAFGEWEHGYPEHYSLPFTDHGLEYSEGDETVPLRSNKDFMGKENIAIASNHEGIVTDAQKRIIKELTGIEPDQEVRTNIFKKYLLVRIFSPADFLVTAPDGKKLGKDFLSGQAVNEIPNAFYSGFGGSIEFAVIPDPIEGEYSIGIEGTASGEYTLSASFISEEEDADQNYAGEIEAGRGENFSFVYSAENEDGPLSELEPEPKTPAEMIAKVIKDVEDIYQKGGITKKISKILLIQKLKHLSNKLEDFAKQKEKTEKQVEEVKADEKLKPKAKQNHLEALNKKLERISENRQKAIAHNLDLLEKRLNIIKDKNRINNEGYAIIIKDINYLRTNL